MVIKAMVRKATAKNQSTNVAEDFKEPKGRRGISCVSTGNEDI